MNLFIVYFNERTLNQVIFIGLAVGDSHDLIECTGNDSHGLLLKFEAGDRDRKVLFGIVDHLRLFG